MEAVGTKKTLSFGRRKAGGSAIKATVPEKIFLVFNYTFFAVLSFLMLAPMMHLASLSVSSESAVLRGDVGLLPDFTNLQFESFYMVFANDVFIHSFLLTVRVTLIGSFVGLAVTAAAAYAVSKPYLRGRKAMLLLCIFIMLFHGGMIPTYVVINGLGLTNTFTVLWITSIFSVFHMLIIKNFYEAIPIEMEESARMDGAGQFTIFLRIYAPTSKAVYAVILLFTAVSLWNNFFTAMLYTTRRDLMTLQLLLMNIVHMASDVFMELHGALVLGEVTTQSVIASSIVVATVPILLVYPLLQKHFTKGVFLGSVKG